MISTTNNYKADIVGILSSSICLVHCIATPILITLGAGYFTNPFFQYIFLCISFLSIYKATAQMTNRKIFLFLWISFGGFLISNILEGKFHLLHYSGYFFGLFIIVGHILNIYYYRKCAHQNFIKNEK